MYFTNRTKATTPVTLPDELKPVTGGSFYIHPAAVLSICPVRKRNGRDGRWFDCRTNRPFRRETVKFCRFKTGVSDN